MRVVSHGAAQENTVPPSSQTAIVTGAAGRIGAALVGRLAERDIRLSLVDVDVDGLERVIAAAGLSSDRVLLVCADVAREADVMSYVEQTVERFGRIDWFANNAGIESNYGAIENQDIDAFDRVYQINIRGVYLGLQKVLPVMKSQGAGAIVNTSSLSGIRAVTNVSPYVMSKHAVIGLTRSAAVEAAPHGIRVNAVLPGPVESEMMGRIEDSSGRSDQFKARNQSSIPLGRYADADEVAAVMSFLLSEQASYVTQSLYTVDGGLSSS